jgi:hypothetical protein
VAHVRSCLGVTSGALACVRSARGCSARSAGAPCITAPTVVGALTAGVISGCCGRGSGGGCRRGYRGCQTYPTRAAFPFTAVRCACFRWTVPAFDFASIFTAEEVIYTIRRDITPAPTAELELKSDLRCRYKARRRCVAFQGGDFPQAVRTGVLDDGSIDARIVHAGWSTERCPGATRVGGLVPEIVRLFVTAGSAKDNLLALFVEEDIIPDFCQLEVNSVLLRGWENKCTSFEHGRLVVHTAGICCRRNQHSC